MTARLVVLLSVVGLAQSVWAQEAPVAASAPAGAGYPGTVNGTNVYVRSGNSTRYYPCTKLSRPAEVTIVENLGEWLKILPPPGTFSVISRQYVRPEADGKAGTVTNENVWVRAGGDLCSWPAIKDFWAIQVQLNAGDRVEILGQSGDYYRIAPPKGAYFYMSGLYVKSAGMPIPIAGRTPPTPAPTPTTAEATVTVTLPPAARTEWEAAEQEYVKARTALEAAEKDLFAEYQKPAADRDLPGLLAKYRAIQVSADSPLKPYVDLRVNFLQSAIARIGEMDKAQALAAEAAEKQRQLALARAKIEAERTEIKPLTTYAAQGVVFTSAIFPGSESAPKRYLLRDPDTLKLGAYVQSVSGGVDLQSYVGKCVGVMGSVRYDKNLGVDIIEVEKVVVLAENVSVPVPPRPTVTPPAPPVLPKAETMPAPLPPAPEPPTPAPMPPTPEPTPPTPEPTPPTPEPTPPPPTPLEPKPEPTPSATGPTVLPTPLPIIKPKPKPKPVAEPIVRPAPMDL